MYDDDDYDHDDGPQFDFNPDKFDPQFDMVFVVAHEFEVLPRPRLEGDNRRRPDAARTSFQSAVARSFFDRPEVPFAAGVVTCHVPGDDTLPAVATLKSIIDATVSAGVLSNDRSALLAGRLTKYRRLDSLLPTTSVEVVPHTEDDPYYGSFITTPEQLKRRKVGICVTDPVAFADRSGIPGAARFQNPWVNDPAEYESFLRSRWRSLVDSGRVILEPEDWAAASLLTARLDVHLPKTCTEDGDNALLFMVDMLDVVRRDILGDDAGERTLDQLLVEVSFSRCLDNGLWLRLSPEEQDDQFTYHFAEEMGWSSPFNPDVPWVDTE